MVDDQVRRIAPQVGRRSPGSMVLAIAEDDTGEPLPEWDDECSIVWKSKFLWRYPLSSYIRFDCGHRDSRMFEVKVFGEQSGRVKQRYFCAQCFLDFHKTHAIRCCYCTRPILVGMPVCLYSIDSPGMIEKAVTVIDQSIVMGCMRWKCGSGGSFGGHWTEDGFKPADFSKFVH